MYHVPPDQFKEFIDKNHLADGVIPKPEGLPCLIEFNKNGVLKAKVEMISFDEFKAVVKFGKIVSGTPKNKYWIRGQEWEKDADGNFIQELKI